MDGLDSITTDVIVVGSGSAALSAALRVAVGGLNVIVLEKTDRFGGTSAMSGAGIWVPNNHVAKKHGLDDSFDEAIAYIRAASPAGWEAAEDSLWKALVHNAPRMLKFIEEHTRLRFALTNEPDPFAEMTGGKRLGRMVSPRPLSRFILGAVGPKVRKSTGPHIFAYQEIVEYDVYHKPFLAGLRLFPRLIWRFFTYGRGQGSGLMYGLLHACMKNGVNLKLKARAIELLQGKDGSIEGVVIEQNNRRTLVRARHGVVLASGGFEWNPEMLAKHFPGPIGFRASPRGNEGDGQQMAQAVGAKLDRMDQANFHACLPTSYEGKLHGLSGTFQSEKYSIVVNGQGHRFVSEADYNYGEALDSRDKATNLPVNSPTWLIGDSLYFKRSLVFRWYASYSKNFIRKADTIAELAEKIGVPAVNLTNTVNRFNAMCEQGCDADFHRGESIWEMHKSGGEFALTSVTKPPFFAVDMTRSILGTKGGARTNEYGQILREDGSVIPRLYAAGLTMANPIGTRAIGAGTTLGPNLTFGFICAESILGAASVGRQEPTSPQR